MYMYIYKHISIYIYINKNTIYIFLKYIQKYSADKKVYIGDKNAHRFTVFLASPEMSVRVDFEG